MKKHKHCLIPDSKEKGQLYYEARKAKAWRMIILTDLSHVGAGRLGVMLSTSEWAFVMLNKSWSPALHAEDAGQMTNW